MIEIDGNAYSVPWRLIGERVRVTATDTVIRVHHATCEVACHAVIGGRRQRVVDPAHYAGIAATNRIIESAPASPPPSDLLRALADYETLIGGGF
jgi:hypothetical protein